LITAMQEIARINQNSKIERQREVSPSCFWTKIQSRAFHFAIFDIEALEY